MSASILSETVPQTAELAADREVLVAHFGEAGADRILAADAPPAETEPGYRPDPMGISPLETEAPAPQDIGKPNRKARRKAKQAARAAEATATGETVKPAKRKPRKISPDKAGPEITVQGARPLQDEAGDVILPWGMTKNNKLLDTDRACHLADTYNRRDRKREKLSREGKECAKALVWAAWAPLYLHGKPVPSTDQLWQEAGGDKVISRATVVWWTYFWRRGQDLPKCATAKQRDTCEALGAEYRAAKGGGCRPVK